MEKTALYIISDGIGGAEQVVWQLLYGFNDKSKFYLIVNNEIASYYSELLPANQTFNIGDIYLPAGKQNKLFRFIYRIIHYSLIKVKLSTSRIINYLQENSIYCIHAHLDYALFSSLIIKKKNKHVKIIYTVHGVLGLIQDKSIKPDIAPRNLNFNSVDSFIFVSDYVHKVYLTNKISIKQGQIIHNGINIRPNSNVVKGLNSTQKFKILYVGGAKYLKGYDLLIDTVLILKESELKNRFQIMVLGNISSDSVFIERIKNQNLYEYFDMIGFVCPPAHLDYFDNAELLFIPSRSETCCIAAIEGIQNNLLIVASNVGALPEIIKDGFNGLLASLDPKDFAIKIIDIFNNYYGYSIKARAINREIVSKFEANNMCNMHLKLYENITKL